MKTLFLVKVIVKEVFRIELVDWGIGFDNILLMHIAIFLAIVRWLVHYLTQLHLQYINMFVNGTFIKYILLTSLQIFLKSVDVHY